MKPDALIFDLDGTLWDSLPAVVHGWNTYLKSEGIDRTITVEDIIPLVGKPIKDFVETLFPVEKERIDDIAEQLQLHEEDGLSEIGGVLYPGVAKTLPQLAEQYPIGLISNCGVEYKEKFFSLFPDLAELFVDSDCYGESPVPKSVMMRNMLARNNWSHAVYIGDTPTDYSNAQDAGLDFVYADYGFGDVPDAPARITRFDELTAMFL